LADRPWLAQTQKLFVKLRVFHGVICRCVGTLYRRLDLLPVNV
jgi:hypothetical protein